MFSSASRAARLQMDPKEFCYLKFNIRKLLSKQYPKEINTLGDHIKKRRLDLGMLQVQVAEKIGADVTTIRNWERQ